MHSCAVVNPELEDLCGAVRVDVGTVFVPWHWSDDATELLRTYGIPSAPPMIRDPLPPLSGSVSRRANGHS